MLYEIGKKYKITHHYTRGVNIVRVVILEEIIKRRDGKTELRFSGHNRTHVPIKEGKQYGITIIEDLEGDEKMLVELDCQAVVKAEINSEEAFKILVKTVDMDKLILQDDKTYCTRNRVGKCKGVYEMKRDYLVPDDMLHDRFVLVDDRGELYDALIALSKQIFPNV